MRETEPHSTVRPGTRNTTAESARSVVPVRLSDSERSRIGHAAAARDLKFSSFVRWAALEAASDRLQREKPRPKPKLAEPEHMPIASVEPERVHHFVDGVCVRCNRDVDGEEGARSVRSQEAEQVCRPLALVTREAMCHDRDAGSNCGQGRPA